MHAKFSTELLPLLLLPWTLLHSMLNPSLNPIAIPDQLLPVVGGVARQARLPPQMIYAPSCLENMPNWRSYSTKGVGFGSQSRLGFSNGLGISFPLCLSACLCLVSLLLLLLLLLVCPEGILADHGLVMAASMFD